MLVLVLVAPPELDSDGPRKDAKNSRRELERRFKESKRTSQKSEKVARDLSPHLSPLTSHLPLHHRRHVSVCQLRSNPVALLQGLY